MKKILISIVSILLTFSVAVNASDLVIESKNQTFTENENKIKFDGDVKVTSGDLTVVGDSADVSLTEKQQLDTATFYDKPYAYEIKKNKKREVKANILKISLITKVVKAEGDTQSIVFDGKTPIAVINADSQEYDTKTGIMKADGTVTILYKEVETFSDHATIKTDKNGDLKNITLIGNARVKEKTSESFADKFVYDPTIEILTATGNTTTKALMDGGGKLVLKSAYQEFNRNKNTYNASGNVHVWYQDYYAVGPKITFFPDKTTGKPNEIFFTGRSSITQGVKTIYADKIRMTLQPKDFEATGNTRTVIKNLGSEDNSDMSLGL